MTPTKDNTILGRGDSRIARDKRLNFCNQTAGASPRPTVKQPNFRNQTANKNAIVYRKVRPRVIRE